MASRFEDLRAWQAARRLTSSVYELIRREPFSRDFALSDQIRRAAVSTMNNIAEGFDSGSVIEFARFLRYAARSASEVQSWLYVALDQSYVTAIQFARVYEHATLVRKLCGALARSLRPRKKHNSPPDRISEPAAPCYAAAASVAPCAIRVATGHRPLATQFMGGR